jgi:hypothetical protein
LFSWHLYIFVGRPEAVTGRTGTWLKGEAERSRQNPRAGSRQRP